MRTSEKRWISIYQRLFTSLSSCLPYDNSKYKYWLYPQLPVAFRRHPDNPFLVLVVVSNLFYFIWIKLVNFFQPIDSDPLYPGVMASMFWILLDSTQYLVFLFSPVLTCPGWAKAQPCPPKIGHWHPMRTQPLGWSQAPCPMHTQLLRMLRGIHLSCFSTLQHPFQLPAGPQHVPYRPPCCVILIKFYNVFNIYNIF